MAEEANFDVDEWDGRGTFTQHAISGSIAGLAEHSVMFPMDTVKTLMQVRQAPRLQALSAEGAVAAGPPLSITSSFVHLTATGGMTRMWRGVQTMFTGCVPAHAAYFSIYEGCKARFNAEGLPASSPAAAAATDAGSVSSSSSSDAAAAAAADGGGGSGSSALASGAAVALATMAHDVIMTPMDCIKQRLQLGYHKNCLLSCACDMLKREGVRAFVLSYPTTLLMNVPYALTMGTSNEALRNALNPDGSHSLTTYLIAGAGAGSIAAAVTNPLDVVKTRLQTQHLRLATDAAAPPAAAAAAAAPPLGGHGFSEASKLAQKACPRAVECPHNPVHPAVRYTGLVQAARTLWIEEGAGCFARGMGARVLIHAPSVAICWTTYESVKHALGRYHIFE